MIKPKTLMLLAAVVVGLGLVSFLQRTRHNDVTSRPATAVLIAGELTADDLARITLGKGDEAEAVVLESTAAGWVVRTVYDSPANMQRITALLRSLSGLKGEFRSDRADVLADYGLDAADAIVIRGYDQDGQQVLALDIGRSPERFPGNFMRNPADNAVYLSGQSVLSPLGVYGEPETPKSRHFLELQAVQEDRLAVNSITLQDKDGQRTLTKVFAVVPPAEDAPEGTEPTIDRVTWEWELADGRALVKTKADAVLGAIVSMRAVDVGDPATDLADYGLDVPQRTAVMELEDGSRVGLDFGLSLETNGSNPSGTWMKVQGEPGIWMATDYAVNNIFKTETDLLPE